MNFQPGPTIHSSSQLKASCIHDGIRGASMVTVNLVVAQIPHTRPTSWMDEAILEGTVKTETSRDVALDIPSGSKSYGTYGFIGSEGAEGGAGNSCRSKNTVKYTTSETPVVASSSRRSF